MFLFNANEPLLANWLLWQQEPQGLFPLEKGWGISFKRVSCQGGEPSFLMFKACLSEETFLWVPVTETSCRATLVSLASLREQKTGLVVFCGQRAVPVIKKQIKSLPALGQSMLLSLGEQSVQTVLGRWENARLEFRLSKQTGGAWGFPQRAPLNPARLDDEFVLSQLFLLLLSGLTQKWLSGHLSVNFLEFVSDTLTLFSVLPKRERKRVGVELENYFRLLIKGPLSGWIALQKFQKKPSSESVIRLVFATAPVNRSQILKQLKRQSNALHYLQTQVLQTSYYETETDPL